MKHRPVRSGVSHLLLAAALFALLPGCAPLRVPVVPDGHPAHPEYGSAEVPPVPSVLDPTRADRRDPASRASTLLHPDMSMHGMDHHDPGGGAHDEH